MEYSSLLATIDANIRANGNEEITGPVLNGVLRSMVSALGNGFQFKGIAQPGDNPGTPDAKVFYLATTPGTYANFGGTTVTTGQVVVFSFDTGWHAAVLITAASLNGSSSEDFAAKVMHAFQVISDTSVTGKEVVGETVGADKVILHNPDNNAMTDLVPGGQPEDIEVAMPKRPGTLALQEDVDAALKQKADIDGYYSELAVGLADELASWVSRGNSPIDSVSYDLIRATGGDESIKSSGGAVLLSMACVGEDFTPVRIISSGRNLLRLRSNNGLAVAVGSGFYFPVPHLVATNDSIGTANENNGVLFTDEDGNNLKPTVYFKPLADGVPTSVTDGTAATYLDKNGRRHYTTSGPGFLIVSGITWAETCAHLGWNTGYDVFTSPTDANDAGTIVSTTNIGTLRSVGSGASMISDRADRISNTQMTKTVSVGVSSDLTWTDIVDTDSEGAATGTYTHTATVSAMQYDGVAEIKLGGGSFIALEVSGTVVSFSDGNPTVESGYAVKYQLATPTTSTINVTTIFPNINDWGIEYVEATGEGQGLWQYTQGVDDAIYALLAKREQDNDVIAEAIAFLSHKIDAFISRVKTYEAKLKVAEIDAKEYKVMNRPAVLRSSVAGAPSADNVPSNWDASLYGTWQGGAISFEQSYVDIASKRWYRPVSITNTPADWVPVN